MSKIRVIDGLPVQDAKHPIKLVISDRDIKGASVKEPLDCVVSRACRRQLHAQEVRVHLSRIYVRANKGNWIRYHTPGNIRTEIIAFDRGGGI